MIRAVLGWLLLVPAVACAQPHRGSIELGGGIGWVGGSAAGSAAANETRNPSTGSTPLTLFQTDSRTLSAATLDVRAGVYITPRLLVSATFQYSRPALRAHLSSDFEGATSIDADTTVSSYTFGATGEYRLSAGGWVPFVSGGAGQLRQVPDGGDVLTAAEIHAGGGIRRALTHGRRPFSIRGEASASFRSRTAGFDQRHHVVPIASAGLMWSF